MKKTLRSFAVGLLVGGLVGLWSGMNIGQGRPLLSNPFADVELGQQASGAASELYQEAAHATAEAGEAVRSTGARIKGAVADTAH